MAIQGNLEGTFDEFIARMTASGHRPATITLVQQIYGQELGLDQFTALYRAANNNLRCSPSAARYLYEYLTKCGIIRINER